MMNEQQSGAPCFICRCYEVTLADVEQAIADGALTVNDVKRRTKAAMGVCQGAYCVPALVALLAERTGQDPAAMAPITARPPVRLIPLESLADLVPEHD